MSKKISALPLSTSITEDSYIPLTEGETTYRVAFSTIKSSIKETNFDTSLNSTSTNAVQNKVVNSAINSLKTELGNDISTLTSKTNSNTSRISTAESDIVDLKLSVSNGKARIAEAITDKGMETSATDSFSNMAGNILQIQTGSGGGEVMEEMALSDTVIVDDAPTESLGLSDTVTVNDVVETTPTVTTGSVYASNSSSTTYSTDANGSRSQLFDWSKCIMATINTSSSNVNFRLCFYNDDGSWATYHDYNSTSGETVLRSSYNYKYVGINGYSGANPADYITVFEMQ